MPPVGPEQKPKMICCPLLTCLRTASECDGLASIFRLLVTLSVTRSVKRVKSGMTLHWEFQHGQKHSQKLRSEQRRRFKMKPVEKLPHVNMSYKRCLFLWAKSYLSGLKLNVNLISGEIYVLSVSVFGFGGGPHRTGLTTAPPGGDMDESHYVYRLDPIPLSKLHGITSFQLLYTFIIQLVSRYRHFYSVLLKYWLMETMIGNKTNSSKIHKKKEKKNEISILAKKYITNP